MHDPKDDSQDLALRHYPALRLSLPYAAEPLRQKLLALYSLIASVEESVCRASDPVVSRARLAWWLEELHQARNNAGNHPVSKFLYSSGALNQLPGELVGRLIVSAENRLDLAGLNNESSLKTLCMDLGMIQLELELALQDDSVTDYPHAGQFAAMNGLVQLLRESSRSIQASYSWIPLSLCAQFEMNRQNLANNPGSRESKALFVGLAKLGLSWLPGTGSMDSLVNEIPKPWGARNLHWVVMTNLQKRQLERVKKRALRGGVSGDISGSFEKPGGFDAWTTWKLARCFNSWRIDQ